MTDVIPAPRTIPARLKYWSEVDPEIPAFIFLGDKEETVFSRGEIFEKAGKMAAFLRRIGVSKGDVIAVSMYTGQNCPDRLICELGIQMAGCVTVEAVADLKDGSDLLEILNVTGAKLIITSIAEICQKHLKPLIKSEIDFSFHVTCSSAPSVKYAVCISNKPGERLGDIIEKEGETFMDDVLEEDLAMIATTSGTTNYVKYVPYTQELLVKVGEHICLGFEVKRESRFYNDRSMSWHPGYPFYYISCGVTRVMRNHMAQPPSLLEVMEFGGYTHAFLTTEDIHELYLRKKMKNQATFEGLNICIAGQPLRKIFMKEALTFVKSVINLYGSTESGIISYLRITNEEEFADYCVGIEKPDIEIKIVDDKENPVESGEIGEILLKSPRQASGYLTADGSLSREGLTEDGWFRIGDQGYRDDKGRLYVTGRGSDVILRGDLLLYPHHLEGFLSGCPGVEDMAVVGVPDPVVYEEICLIVKGDGSCNDPTSIAKSFIDDIIDQSNKEYSVVPKYIIACDSTLRTRNGKLNRKKLAKYAIKKLGIGN